MIVIVGHGPSILTGRGAVIDSHTVVRLKRGLARKFNDSPPDPIHWGTRTDYLFARSPIFEPYALGASFMLYRDERLAWFQSFNPSNPKPSTGLCAVFAVVERLKPEAIGLIGFDRLLAPGTQDARYDGRLHCWGHDEHAEHRALHALGVPIIDLRADGYLS